MSGAQPHRRVRGTHVPMRTCVGCRAVRPQAELLRLSLPGEDPGGPATFDSGTRRRGRGAYLCAASAPACLALARRRRALPRALHTTADRVDVDLLTEVLAADNLEVSSSPR